jgi:hypothetical protein
MSARTGLPGAGVRALVAIVAVVLTRSALAGPVLVYRQDGWCPHDRPADAPRISAEQAIERAKALLPKEFCGPDWYVDGCDYDPERAFDSWRVYAHQYKMVDGRKEFAGRDHSYVVLDAVGNCKENIQGT